MGRPSKYTPEFREGHQRRSKIGTVVDDEIGSPGAGRLAEFRHLRGRLDRTEPAREGKPAALLRRKSRASAAYASKSLLIKTGGERLEARFFHPKDAAVANATS